MTDEQEALVESIAKSTKRTISLLYVQLSLCLYVCVMLAGNGARGYLGAGKEVRLPIIDFPIHYRAFSVIGPWMVVSTSMCLYFELRRLYRWYQELAATRCDTPRDWSIVVEPSIFGSLVLDRGMKSTDRLVLSVLVGAAMWLVPVFTVWLFAWEFSALHGFWSSTYHALVVLVMTGAAFVSGLRCDVWVDTQKRRTRALVYALRIVLAFVPVGLAANYAVAAARGEFPPFAEGRFESFVARASLPLNLSAERAAFETLDRAAERPSPSAEREMGFAEGERDAGAGAPQFIGVELSAMPLQSADLRGADLRGVDFRGSDLSGAMLEGADLRDANFTRRRVEYSGDPLSRLGVWMSPAHRHMEKRSAAIATRCADEDADEATEPDVWVRSIRVPATLEHARMENVLASNARFGCAQMSQARMRRIDLTRASLNRADLTGVKLNEAMMRNSNLRRVDLTCAALDNADLGGADIFGARLDRTSLCNAILAVRVVESVQSDCTPAFSSEADAALTRTLGRAGVVRDALVDDRAIASITKSWNALANRKWRVTRSNGCWTARQVRPDDPDPCAD